MTPVDAASDLPDLPELVRLRTAPRWRWLALGAVAAALATLAATSGRGGKGAGGPSGAKVLPSEAPTGAFAEGGVPGTSAVIDETFGPALSRFVALLDEWVRTEPNEHDAIARARLVPLIEVARQRVLSGRACEVLGPTGCAHLGAALSYAIHAASAGEMASEEALTRAMQAELGSLDDALAARNLGYVVDGDVVISRGGGGRHVILYAYRVARVVRVRVVGEIRRALWVRRLDALDISVALWGRARSHLRDALVLIDELDASLIEMIMPTLAPGADLRLCDVDAYYQMSPWSRKVSQRAGAFARQELRSALGAEDRETAESIGMAVLQRNERVSELHVHALDVGRLLRAPRGLAFPAAWLVRVRTLGFAADADALMAADKLVATLGASKLQDSLRELLADRIARHEAQHLADAALPTPLRLPEALADITGPLTTSYGHERREVARARDELSAYLATLAREDEMPRLMLALAMRPLLDQDAWGSPEAAAAIVILDGLAARLAIADEPLVEKGAVLRARVVERYRLLTEVEPERLQRAARELWEHLFAAKFPEIEVLRD